ncbi:MAG: hypothetical protein Q9162_005257 [Coniocarpon cinnabarinum]
MSGAEFLAVLSVAANCAQLITFSAEVADRMVGGTLKKGSVEWDKHLEELARRQTLLATKLPVNGSDHDQQRVFEEKEIIELGLKISEKAEELQKALASIKVEEKHGTRERLKRSAKAPFKYSRTIQPLANQLKDLQANLTSFMIRMLSDDTIVIRETMNAVRQSQASLHEKVVSIQDQFDDTLRMLRIKGSINEQISRRLLELDQEYSPFVKQQAIIDSLGKSKCSLTQSSKTVINQLHYLILAIGASHFADECREDSAELRMREDEIEEASVDTVEWAFDKEHANQDLHLMQWLENGSGIFWIRGQAGSGKSTFMKHVANHAKTEEALTNWASGRRLVKAKHFFSRIG